MRKKISIKWKLFLSYLGFSLIMLLLLWIFQILMLGNFYKSIKTNEIKSYAKTLAKNIDSMSTYVSEQDNEICVSVFDENGLLTYSSDIIRTCAIHKMPSGMLYTIADKILDNSDEKIEIISDTGPFSHSKFNLKPGTPNSLLYILKSNGYTIILNAHIAPVDATVTTLRTQLIYITIIMGLLSFLLSIRASKNISNPIIKMNEKAKVLATGNYDVNFEEGNYKEISELAQTLNYSANELSKVDNLRKELIANISHDLRTPLTMIIGYSEVMRDIPEENSSENVQVIIDEAKRLSSLVNDVLDISKMQSGTQEIHKNDFNLTKTLESVLSRYSKLTEKDGFTINFEKDDDVIVNADEILITQVIYNLMNNAVTYTGEDKKITVKQTVTNGKVKIEIHDSGKGISAEDLPYIWDRYYRINEEHKRAKIGTGLGLSIVKGILKMHNSDFGVESELNKGSSFWFELECKNP